MGEREDEKRLAELSRDRRKDRQKARTWRQKRTAADPTRIGELLSSFFKKDAEALRKIEEKRALFAWQKFVGPAASQVSRAVAVHNNRLIVEVKDPLWSQQLLLIKSPLLKKYWREFPTLRLKDIYFKTRTI